MSNFLVEVYNESGWQVSSRNYENLEKAQRAVTRANNKGNTAKLKQWKSGWFEKYVADMNDAKGYRVVKTFGFNWFEVK